MTLDNVTKRVVERGRQAANAELDRARAEAKAILEDAERQAAAVRSRRTAELETAIEALRRREVASAELDAKKAQLNAQKDVLAQLRAHVEHRLTDLGHERRLHHVQALVKVAGVKDGRVFVTPTDKAAAEKGGVPVAGTIEGLGGVVVESQDGQTREDLRYEAILDEVWRESLKDAADILFAK